MHSIQELAVHLWRVYVADKSSPLLAADPCNVVQVNQCAEHARTPVHHLIQVTRDSSTLSSALSAFKTYSELRETLPILSAQLCTQRAPVECPRCL